MCNNTGGSPAFIRKIDGSIGQATGTSSALVLDECQGDGPTAGVVTPYYHVGTCQMTEYGNRVNGSSTWPSDREERCTEPGSSGPQFTVRGSPVSKLNDIAPASLIGHLEERLLQPILLVLKELLVQLLHTDVLLQLVQPDLEARHLLLASLQAVLLSRVYLRGGKSRVTHPIRFGARMQNFGFRLGSYFV